MVSEPHSFCSILLFLSYHHHLYHYVVLILCYYAFPSKRLIIRFPPPHILIPISAERPFFTVTSKLMAFVLLPFYPSNHRCTTTRCPNSHARFRPFSLYIHDTPDIGPPLDPALCAVHLFLPCATTAARCSTFTTLCTSTYIRSFVYILQARLRNTVHMCLAWPLLLGHSCSFHTYP